MRSREACSTGGRRGRSCGALAATHPADPDRSPHRAQKKGTRRNLTMLYTCSPAAPHAMRVVAKRSRRGAAPRRHFTIDIHCHVFTPEADRLAQPGFRPDYQPMLRDVTAATREVNRKQNETIR